MFRNVDTARDRHRREIRINKEIKYRDKLRVVRIFYKEENARDRHKEKGGF